MSTKTIFENAGFGALLGEQPSSPLGYGVDMHLDTCDVSAMVALGLGPSPRTGRRVRKKHNSRLAHVARRDMRRMRDRHDLWEVEERRWVEDAPPFLERPCADCGEPEDFLTECYRCGVLICESCEIQRCPEGFHACSLCGRSIASCSPAV